MPSDGPLRRGPGDHPGAPRGVRPHPQGLSQGGGPLPPTGQAGPGQSSQPGAFPKAFLKKDRGGGTSQPGAFPRAFLKKDRGGPANQELVKGLSDGLSQVSQEGPTHDVSSQPASSFFGGPAPPPSSISMRRCDFTKGQTRKAMHALPIEDFARSFWCLLPAPFPTLEPYTADVTF